MKRIESGHRLAVWLLLLATAWMLLRASGLFATSPIRFPGWTGILAALGLLAGPAILMCSRSLHQIVVLITTVGFLACAFVFPWFYAQQPLYFWVTILLAYAEIFWLLPMYMKRRRTLEKRA